VEAHAVERLHGLSCALCEDESTCSALVPKWKYLATMVSWLTGKLRRALPEEILGSTGLENFSGRKVRPVGLFKMTTTAKTVDFVAAARRHMADAKLLEENSRIPNAGHLYGYVAECGLKALLIGSGYPTDEEGSPRNQKQKPKIRTHIDQLVIPETILHLSVFLEGRSGAKYFALLPSIADFSDWEVAHRYYSEAALPNSIGRWRAASLEVARMLDQARIDGATW
jgi:hypothetical protein